MYAYRMVSNNFPNFPYRKSPDCFLFSSTLGSRGQCLNIVFYKSYNLFLAFYFFNAV